MKRCGLIFFVLLARISFSFACPSVEKTERILKGLFKGSNIKIVKVSPAPLKGLCEVVISQGKRKGLTYIDESGNFLLVGRIIELRSRKDLTRERIAELNRVKLSPEQLKELKRHVAFSAGSGPEVFFITDPDCPFCKKAEKILWELIKKNQIKVNVVFFPIEKLHPKAKDKAISMICEGRGFEALIEGYHGNRTCPEGQKKIEESLKFIKSLGIQGTPTFVFSSGLTHSGVLSKEKILKMIKDGS